MQSVNSLLSGMTEPRLSELRRRLESKSVDSGCHIDTHAFFYILYDCGVIVDRWLTIQVYTVGIYRCMYIYVHTIYI